MDFFKAVFSDDPTPSSDNRQDPDQTEHDANVDPNRSFDSDDNSAWSFGGLIKTIASKSESVIETYRRDFEEFGSGLKMETAVIRDAASRAVKDLPSSLDIGASVAQESLESVGQAIDDIGSSVWKSTTQIISQGRDTLLAGDIDSDSSDYNHNVQRLSSSSKGSDFKRYSRFDALVRALQCDVNTYLEDPEDLESYKEWKLGFELDNKEEDIENLIKENGVVEEIYGKVVPTGTDHESFWNRYFYKLNKLKLAENARAKLVKRAIEGDEEEDLSWDFDDEDDENDGYEPKGNSSGVTELEKEKTAEVAKDNVSIENVEMKEKDTKVEHDVKGVEPESKNDGEGKLDDKNIASNASETVIECGDKLDVKHDEKAGSEANTDNGGSCKDSDISIVSSQPSMPEEEDLGWDEIEGDIGGNDENKGDAAGITSKIDLRKRLGAADEEEDLSWDIEDDDEPVKS